jgi:glycerophosphoryl diester phosphodiesterase
MILGLMYFKLPISTSRTLLFSFSLCLFLSSCSSTTNTPTLTQAEITQQAQTQQGRKAAFAARGFYETELGNINYLNARQCSGFELQSHRGSIRYDENSTNAVLDAIDNNFDVIEIDVRVTRDDVWVVHHDAYTGRETGTVDNKRRKIESMNYKKEWGYVRHRNHISGLLTDDVPPSFSKLASRFARFKHDHQQLNIEIKSKASVDELKLLDYIAYKYLGEGNYYFSSLEMRNLTRMRDINPDIYLVYIQSPAKTSMNILATSIKRGAGSDPIYQRNKEQLESLQALGNRRHRVTRYDSPLNLDKLTKLLKRNFGYTLDIRHYQQSAKGLKPSAQARGIKLATYSINGHDYHEQTLLAQRAKDRPDSVIIDDTVYGFCTAFGLPKVTPMEHLIGDEEGIASLPDDLDLSRIDDLSSYLNNGLYPALGGQLKSLSTSAGVFTPSTAKAQPNFDIGTRQADEEFSLDTKAVVELEIRKEKKNKP